MNKIVTEQPKPLSDRLSHPALRRQRRRQLCLSAFLLFAAEYIHYADQEEFSKFLSARAPVVVFCVAALYLIYAAISLICRRFWRRRYCGFFVVGGGMPTISNTASPAISLPLGCGAAGRKLPAARFRQNSAAAALSDCRNPRRFDGSADRPTRLSVPQNGISGCRGGAHRLFSFSPSPPPKVERRNRSSLYLKTWRCKLKLRQTAFAAPLS